MGNKFGVNQFFSFLSKKGYIFILAFASILPFFIYGRHVIISPYNSYKYANLKDLFLVWLSGNGGFFVGLLSSPVDILVWFLSQVFPEWFVVEFSFAMALIMALFSMFFLALHFFRNKAISLIVSLVYGYSIYGQFASIKWLDAGGAIFALVPFFFWRFARFSSTHSFAREVAILGLVSALLVGVNLTFLFYLWALCLGVIIFRFFYVSRKMSIRLLLLFFSWLIFFVLINAPFFFPFFSEYFSEKTYVVSSLAAESVNWKSSTNAPSELWREMGSVNFYYEFPQSVFTYPNAQIFIQNKMFVLLSYVIPVLALSSFLLKAGPFWKRLRVFIGITLTFSLFMAMGVFENSPTRFLYKYIAAHIPFFSIFRDAYKPMFIVNLMYSILLGFFLWSMKRKWPISFFPISFTIVMITLILSFQFWGGSFLQHEFINVPNSWYSLHEHYLSKGDDRRIIFMPEMPHTVYDFTSQRGKFTMFYRPLLSWNNVSNIDVSPGQGMNEVFHLAYDNYENETFAKILGLYGIRYILIQYDADWKAYNVEVPDIVERNMNMKNITRVKNFSEDPL